MIDTVACAVLTDRQGTRTRPENVVTISTQNEQDTVMLCTTMSGDQAEQKLDSWNLG